MHLRCCSHALTHWGQVTHICISKLTIIGWDNGLSPDWRQAIISTDDGILLIWIFRTHFSEIISEIHTFSFKKMHFKMSSGKWRPSCLGLNVLNHQDLTRCDPDEGTWQHGSWSTLVQVTAYCIIGDKPLPEPMLIICQLDTYGQTSMKRFFQENAHKMLSAKWHQFSSGLSVSTLLVQNSGPRFNIKMSSYQYRKSHCGDNTVVRSSYLHNGISYTGKMSSLYWFRPQNISDNPGQSHACWWPGSLHC